MATAVAPSKRSTAGTALKIGIARGALLDALARATTALPKRTTLPILNMVLVRPTSGELALTCSDLSQTVETSVPAVVSGETAAALPAKRLLEIVKSLPGSATIEITLSNEGRAKIVAGRSKFEMAGMPVDEFPRTERPKSDASATVDGRVLAALLGRVIPQASHEMSRVAMNCVLLDIDETGAVLVATDAMRIGRLTIDLAHGKTPLSGQYSIPRTAITAITALFGECESVAISGSRQQLVIEAGESKLSVQMIGEVFPAYRHLFGVTPVAHCVLDRVAFTDALKRVAAISQLGRVDLAFTESEVRIAAVSPDDGNAEDVIDCAFTPGEGVLSPFGLGLNSEHLIDAMAAVQGEQTRIDFTSAKTPVYIRDAATPDSTSTVATLPLREKGEGGR